MQFTSHELTFDTGPHAGERWHLAMRSSHGLSCAFDARRSVDSTVKGWLLGEVGVSVADLAAQTLAPVGEDWSSWQGEWIFVKHVTAGHVHVSWRDSMQRFDAGSMFVIDPVHPFVEVFAERATMTVLRIPKASLRERGVRYSTVGPLAGDSTSPDVRAACDLIECIAKQCTAPSAVAQKIMGAQLLELVQFTVIDPAAREGRRSAQALIHRAKRYVDSHLADAHLDVAAIARAVHVSAPHLQRLFRDERTSLMRYVWHARLERAALLLRANGSRSVSIQEIAWQCGFSSAAHFSRLFKQQYGESPSDFRYSTKQVKRG